MAVNILTEREQELVSLLAKDCKTTGEIHEKLKLLFAGTIEKMLEDEMDEHVADSGGRRNGYRTKTLNSEYGTVKIQMPRDRNNSFEPQILGKHQWRTTDIEDKIVTMYAKGMTLRAIESQMKELYGTEVSKSLVTKITNKVWPEVEEWQRRQIEREYAIIYVGSISFNIQGESKEVYMALGVNADGHKSILGIWIEDDGSPDFWEMICNELKLRGVRDISLVCHNNVKGLSSAVNNVFPSAKEQYCVVHQVRASSRLVNYHDKGEVCEGLKGIYEASDYEGAIVAREEFRDKWGEKYPAVVKQWDRNWEKLMTFYEFPVEMQKVVYTTNAMEGFCRTLRRYTNVEDRKVFPSREAVLKSVYLAVREIVKAWTQPLKAH